MHRRRTLRKRFQFHGALCSGLREAGLRRQPDRVPPAEQHAEQPLHDARRPIHSSRRRERAHLASADAGDRPDGRPRGSALRHLDHSLRERRRDRRDDFRMGRVARPGGDRRDPAGGGRAGLAHLHDGRRVRRSALRRARHAGRRAGRRSRHRATRGR